MKTTYSLSTIFIAFIGCATIVTDVMANAGNNLEWQSGSYGDFLQCAEQTYAFGYCSSGKNADCQGSYTKLGCGSFPQQSKSTSSTSSDPGLNNWVCATYGEFVECPPGKVMIGACGTAKNAHCEEYCKDSKYHSAVLCAYPPANTPVGHGSWSEPYKSGQTSECPANQVSCGVCQSGKNDDCSGGKWRMRCCDIGDHDVKGVWKPTNQLVATGTYTYSVGTTKAQSETQTSTWSSSMTVTVAAGLTVKGGGGAEASLSSTMSEEFSKTDQTYWEMSETHTWETNFDESHVGMQVWQWEYEIRDVFGYELTTLSPYLATTLDRGVAPKCLPGYMKGSDSQTCVSEEGTLPGYENNQGRRSLRGFTVAGAA